MITSRSGINGLGQRRPCASCVTPLLQDMMHSSVCLFLLLGGGLLDN